MATVLDSVIEGIHRIQRKARPAVRPTRPRWPMIVVRSPKGWTVLLDGLQIEGTFGAHQVPLLVDEALRHVELLDAWMRSYKPE